MVRIYTGSWRRGDDEYLSPGYHYKKKSKTLIVPEGYVVTFYKNQDRQGWKSRKFYKGNYQNLYFYNIPSSPGVILVEKTDLRHKDMITAIWYNRYGKDKKYRMHMKIPVGKRKRDDDFPDDKIEELEIPFGTVAEVFKDDKDGGSLIFSGNNPKGNSKIKLKEYDYSKVVSRMKIYTDEWVLAGIALEDESVTESSEEQIGATIDLSNNSPYTATISKEISCSVDEEVGEEWNVEAGVTASVETTAGAMGIEVTAGIEVSVSAGYGQSKTTTNSVGFNDSIEVEVPGYGNAKASMIIEMGRMECVAVRKWRNKRTNAIIEERGKIKFSKANRVRVEVH